MLGYQLNLATVRKSRAACAQSFAMWQQATIEMTRRDNSRSHRQQAQSTVHQVHKHYWRSVTMITPSGSLYYCLFAPHIHSVFLHAHPVRGESHILCNATGEVATQLIAKWFIKVRALLLMWTLINFDWGTDNFLKSIGQLTRVTFCHLTFCLRPLSCECTVDRLFMFNQRLMGLLILWSGDPNIFFEDLLHFDWGPLSLTGFRHWFSKRRLFTDLS